MPNHANKTKLYFSSLTTNQNFTYRWSNMDTEIHQHVDFYEISLITQSAYTHIYESIEETLDAGTLIFFDVNQSHRMMPKSPDSIHFTLCLTKPYFQFLMQIFSFDLNIVENSGYAKCKLNDTTFQYLYMLANTLANQEAESHNVKLFFHNALSLLSTHNLNNSLLNKHDFVDDILEKINNYSYLTISIQEIYNHYPYSVPTIIKKFKQRTGMTIVRYQANARLDCAARLMRETNHSIEQIVANLGFQSTGHFYEIFKSRYGLTPNVYRTMAKEQPDNPELLPLNVELP